MHSTTTDTTGKLLAEARGLGIRIIFKRLENAKPLETLRELGVSGKQPIYAQGYLWDQPQPLLALSDRTGAPTAESHGVAADLCRA